MSNSHKPIVRKTIKKAARKVVRQHYLILVVTLIFAGILGARFTDNFGVFNLPTGQAGSETQGTVSSVASLNSVIDAAINNTMDDYIERSREAETEAKSSGFSIGALGLETQSGFIASIITKMSSGGIFVMVYSAIRNLVKSDSTAGIIFIVISLLLTLAFWIFIVNIYKVIYNRIFLEARLYKKVPLTRFAFLFRVRKYLKAVCTMLVLSIFEFLWSLTIIGGMIKRYSYYMVPFIVAENPDIRPLEAIRLSRMMMNGYKWKVFVFELSFIPWDLLNTITFGLLGTFFLNPYRVAAETEYYAALRSIYKSEGGEKQELLNDTYLYEYASDELIKETYADIEAWANEAPIDVEFGGKVKRFFAKWFGIVLSYNNDEDRAVRAAQIRKHKIERWHDISEKLLYPERLSAFPVTEKRESMEDLGYNRCYSISSLIMIFFALCFVGWLWEVTLHLVKDGILVNRGILFGPWLPIYGSGSVLILIVLRRLREKPIVEFIAAVVLCGVVEYLTSYLMEVMHDGKKWWDYHGVFLNLNGRICAEGLIVFGLGGIAVVYVLAPLVDNLVRKIKTRVLVPILAVLVLAFSADLVYSHFHPNEGKGITDYGEANNDTGQSSSSEPSIMST